MPCESLFSPTDFRVDNLTMIVFEGATPPPPGTPSLGIIRTNQPWGVDVDWVTNGILVPFVGGQFEVNLFAESLGPFGPELKFGPVVVPVTPGPAPVSYHAEVRVAAGTPALPAGETTMLYEIVASLTSGDLRLTPAPLACHTEDTKIQFYLNP